MNTILTIKVYIIIIINYNDRERAETVYTCNLSACDGSAANKIWKDKRSEKNGIAKTTGTKVVEREGGRWAKIYKNVFRQRPHFAYVCEYLYFYYYYYTGVSFFYILRARTCLQTYTYT